MDTGSKPKTLTRSTHGPSAPRHSNGQTHKPRRGSVDPSASVGQFSFAPATQTTVVTTTTTTTTKFPPFVMRPPRRTHELDPKHYPLAATPTPASLRNFRFLVDGKATVFREYEDTSIALEEVSPCHNPNMLVVGLTRTSSSSNRNSKTFDWPMDFCRRFIPSSLRQMPPSNS